MSERIYARVPFVERELAKGRRLVQAVGADVPTQLSGSAPLIWDLLAEHGTVDGVVSMLQQHFTDPPSILAAGVETALGSFGQASLITES